MRQMTLNNALNEQNVWFKVTPEQAIQINTNSKNKHNITFVIVTNQIITFHKYDENSFLTFLEHQYKNSLEQIQIIDEVPFKTQKEVWEFLVSNDGNVVEHTLDGRKLTMVDGRLTVISDALPPSGNYSAINFTVPELWRPSSELYKPKLKEWWELNGNKPTLCWYGDDLPINRDVCTGVGLVVHTCTNENFQFSNLLQRNNWKYAIPLTREEIEEFIFKPLENG